MVAWKWFNNETESKPTSSGRTFQQGFSNRAGSTHPTCRNKQLVENSNFTRVKKKYSEKYTGLYTTLKYLEAVVLLMQNEKWCLSRPVFVCLLGYS